MDTNLIIKTKDGEIKVYTDADYSVNSNGLITVIKMDRTVDTYHMTNVYYIREEKTE